MQDFANYLTHTIKDCKTKAILHPELCYSTVICLWAIVACDAINMTLDGSKYLEINSTFQTDWGWYEVLVADFMLCSDIFSF